MAAIVADYDDEQVAKQVGVPFSQLKPSELHGRVRIAWFHWKPTVAIAATKVVRLAKLPKNARIITGVITSNAFVATSTLDVGLIGADASGIIDNPTDATADSAVFFTGAAALAVATAGAYAFANNQANNEGYVLQKECYLIGKLNTAGMDGAADVLEGYVQYVVD